MRTYVSVVEAGSFTAAGERMGMSKKLVSKYIGELEARLKVKLLNRTTRTLSMTSAGQKYYPRCVALLEEYDALQAELRDDDVGLSGKLRISAPISFGEAYVLDDIMAFQDLHPDLEVDIQLNDRYVDLAGEGFDLAIRIGRLEDSGLFSRKLSTTRLLPVASPSYLAQHGEPVHPNELQDHNCFRDSNFRQGYNWPFYINGQEQKVAIKGGIIVNSTTAVRDLALSGRGICLCPSYVVQNDIKAGRLMHILPDFESISLTIQVVFSDNKKMPSRTRAMLDFLVERYKSAAWL